VVVAELEYLVKVPTALLAGAAAQEEQTAARVAAPILEVCTVAVLVQTQHQVEVLCVLSGPEQLVASPQQTQVTCNGTVHSNPKWPTV
jgi:hypothetical protein